MSSITHRAMRGASLLDTYFDGDRAAWAREVDPDRLDQGRPDTCVLGQLFGSFADGIAALDIGADDWDAWEATGFDCSDDDCDQHPTMSDAQETLTNAWLAIVAMAETMLPGQFVVARQSEDSDDAALFAESDAIFLRCRAMRELADIREARPDDRFVLTERNPKTGQFEIVRD